jgi:hypothetical protein
MVLARNLFALIAGCGVAAVLLNMMEPNIAGAAERFLRGNPESTSTEQELANDMKSMFPADDDAVLAELALAEFMINPSGKVDEAKEAEK